VKMSRNRTPSPTEGTWCSIHVERYRQVFWTNVNDVWYLL
jgi:hypothetical protein